jgi:molecular chaperone DnaK
MGRRHHEVENEEKMVPYGVEGAADEYVKIKVGDKAHSPQEVSAQV